MISRAFVLLGLSVKAFFHRLRHDLAREIVVALSSLIILATFFYVFNDFLNVEVASLSPAMRTAFAKVASALTLTAAATFAGTLIAEGRHGDRTLSSFARVSGEEPAVVRLFNVLRGALAIVLCHGLGWWINQRWLFELSPKSGVPVVGLMLGITIVVAFRRKKSRQSIEAQVKTKTTLLTNGRLSIGSALVAWRIVQMVFRNRLSRLCLGMGALLALPVVWAGFRGAPPFVAATCGLGAGFVASLAMVFFVADDITQAWTERGAGVSHGQFVGAYEAISWLVGSIYALAGAGLYLVASLTSAGQSLLHGGQEANALMTELSHTGKVFCITLLPFLTAPWLMFQIDARRPSITSVVSLLVNLFVGTALLASWLSIILVPILRYYGLQSQNGRFYRA